MGRCVSAGGVPAPVDGTRVLPCSLLLLHAALLAAACSTARCLFPAAGTIPRTDPSEELSEVDQEPPESVAAGPTAGYAGRANATSMPKGQ